MSNTSSLEDNFKFHVEGNKIRVESVNDGLISTQEACAFIEEAVNVFSERVVSLQTLVNSLTETILDVNESLRKFTESHQRQDG